MEWHLIRTQRINNGENCFVFTTGRSSVLLDSRASNQPLEALGSTLWCSIPSLEFASLISASSFLEQGESQETVHLWTEPGWGNGSKGDRNYLSVLSNFFPWSSRANAIRKKDKQRHWEEASYSQIFLEWLVCIYKWRDQLSSFAQDRPDFHTENSVSQETISWDTENAGFWRCTEGWEQGPGDEGEYKTQRAAAEKQRLKANCFQHGMDTS